MSRGDVVCTSRGRGTEPRLLNEIVELEHTKDLHNAEYQWEDIL